MTNDALAIFAGAMLSACVLLIEHIVLWPYQHQITKQKAYVIGVATIGLGILLSAALLGDWRIAIAFGCVSGLGGAVVTGAYWYREIEEQRKKSREIAARIKTRVEDSLNVPGRTDDWRN